MDVFTELRSKLVAGGMDEVTSIVKKLIAEGIDPREVLEKALIPGMNEVGEKMGKKEMFIPEVLLSARAMEAGLNLLRPFLLQKGNYSAKGTVVLGTVAGDIHDIGKNLVRYMLEGGGFEVIDLGIDVSPQKFLHSIHDHKPIVLGMSAMLTTTMQEMEKTIKLLQQEGCRNKVKVIVGGAPINRNYADHIGADGYAKDASEVIPEVSKLVCQG